MRAAQSEGVAILLSTLSTVWRACLCWPLSRCGCVGALGLHFPWPGGLLTVICRLPPPVLWQSCLLSCSLSFLPGGGGGALPTSEVRFPNRFITSSGVTRTLVTVLGDYFVTPRLPAALSVHSPQLTAIMTSARFL